MKVGDYDRHAEVYHAGHGWRVTWKKKEPEPRGRKLLGTLIWRT